MLAPTPRKTSIYYLSPGEADCTHVGTVPSSRIDSSNLRMNSLEVMKPLLIIVLLGECLWPIASVLTEFSHNWTPLCFGLLAVITISNTMRSSTWLKIVVWLSCELLLMGILYMPQSQFQGIELFRGLDLFHWQVVLAEDMHAFLYTSFAYVSMETKLVLFFTTCSLFCSIVQSASWIRQQTQFLAVSIFCYLGLIQFFVDVDTMGGMMRTFVIGLCSRMLTHNPASMLSYVARDNWKPLFKHTCMNICYLGCVIALGWCTAWWMSPLSKSWSEAIDVQSLLRYAPYMETWLGTHQANRYSRSGYSQDDSKLGGPLTLDDQILFTAKTDDTGYWRAETKSIYTGKGWQSSKKSSYTNLMKSMYDSSTVHTHEVLLKPHFQHNQIYFPGKLVRIEQLINQKGKFISIEETRINEETGKLKLPFFSGQVQRYVITTIPYSQARKDDNSNRDSEAEGTKVLQTNLQLPAQFPDRIRSLATQLTASAHRSFDRAKAIEKYIKTHYTYNLQKPTVPEPGVDFVYHFLFVDRTGYCTHFSTAMVVMLRSIGIPARWVKGFVPDSRDSSHRDGTIAVTSKNVHAWVEAYIPEYGGWMHFEPTPGYSSFSEQLDNSTEAIPTFGSTIQETTLDQARHSTLIRRGLMVGISGILLFLCWSYIGHIRQFTSRLMGTSRQWVIRRIICRQVSCQSATHPLSALAWTWRKIEHTYGQRHRTQTYREYMSQLQIDDHQLRQLLLDFVSMCESLHYSHSPFSSCSRTKFHALIQALHQHFR